MSKICCMFICLVGPKIIPVVKSGTNLMNTCNYINTSVFVITSVHKTVFTKIYILFRSNLLSLSFVILLNTRYNFNPWLSLEHKLFVVKNGVFVKQNISTSLQVLCRNGPSSYLDVLKQRFHHNLAPLERFGFTVT